MDVSPCNSLFDLRFVALVLSKTLNGSSKGKGINEELKGRQFLPAFLFWIAADFFIKSGMNTFKLHDANFKGGRGAYVVKVRFKGKIFIEKQFITRSRGFAHPPIFLLSLHKGILVQTDESQTGGSLKL